jgi:hypothetical protein
MNGVIGRRMVSMQKNDLPKRGLAQTLKHNKDDLNQKLFEEDLTLSIAKELVPLSFVEVPFFRRLVMRQNPCLVFPSRQALLNNILPRLAKQTKERFILSTLKSCHSCTISFDIWISKAKMDTFVMIVHFLNDKWEPYHIIVDFFEIVDTLGNAMALQVNDVFAKYGLNV